MNAGVPREHVGLAQRASGPLEISCSSAPNERRNARSSRSPSWSSAHTKPAASWRASTSNPRATLSWSSPFASGHCAIAGCSRSTNSPTARLSALVCAGIGPHLFFIVRRPRVSATIRDRFGHGMSPKPRGSGLRLARPFAAEREEQILVHLHPHRVVRVDARRREPLVLAFVDALQRGRAGGAGSPRTGPGPGRRGAAPARSVRRARASGRSPTSRTARRRGRWARCRAAAASR